MFKPKAAANCGGFLLPKIFCPVFDWRYLSERHLLIKLAPGENKILI